MSAAFAWIYVVGFSTRNNDRAWAGFAQSDIRPVCDPPVGRTTHHLTDACAQSADVRSDDKFDKVS
jgi:hypothetical protein